MAYVIAEIGVNHDGSLDQAKRLIDIVAASGADAAKFQSFQADRLVSRAAKKAAYQIETTGEAESQYAMLKRLELDEAAHVELRDYCSQAGVEFLSSPFDLESVDLLVERLNLPRIKLPSGEITNAPLLHQVAKRGKPVILSTGMCHLEEIEQALGILALGYSAPDTPPSQAGFRTAYASAEGQRLLRANVTLLHCTTEYPAPFDEINLRVMDTLREAFQLEVGYSDHTPGIAIPIAAVARGATIVEKHVTLDRNLPGPDHRASLEPFELTAMVQGIRQVQLALGSPIKAPTPSERKNASVARKSLVALKPIRKGEAFTPETLGIKRPGTGISPTAYWDWLGRTAEHDYAPDEVIGS